MCINIDKNDESIPSKISTLSLLADSVGDKGSAELSPLFETGLLKRPRFAVRSTAAALGGAPTPAVLAVRAAVVAVRAAALPVLALALPLTVARDVTPVDEDVATSADGAAEPVSFPKRFLRTRPARKLSVTLSKPEEANPLLAAD